MRISALHTEKADSNPISKAILRYLVKNPESRDTMEGIMKWWLLEQEIQHQRQLVERAIRVLVEKGYLIRKQESDSQVHYQINKEKYSEILQSLEDSG